MNQEPRDGEPIYLELVDALELYAAIVGGTVEQAAWRVLADTDVEIADTELAHVAPDLI